MSRHDEWVDGCCCRDCPRQLSRLRLLTFGDRRVVLRRCPRTLSLIPSLIPARGGNHRCHPCTGPLFGDGGVGSLLLVFCLVGSSQYICRIGCCFSELGSAKFMQCSTRQSIYSIDKQYRQHSAPQSAYQCHGDKKQPWVPQAVKERACMSAARQ